MNTNDIATELDRAFAAARGNALMDVGDTVNPLYAIHKALNAKHACGELTDQQYTEKARELLEMLRSLGVMRWRKLNAECVK